MPYIKYEVNWTPKTCPRCQQRLATGHGWLFKEPAPSLPEGDKRKPVGEMYMHDDAEDCVVLGSPPV
jgi:hypothetical protein